MDNNAAANDRMDPEVKTLWLQALKSGNYKQTVGALNNSSGYCCLGVLCDVAVKQNLAEWESAWAHRGLSKGIRDQHPNRGEYVFTSMLPPKIDVWAGIPEFKCGALIQINDHSDDFTDAIKYIEENL